MGGPPEPPAGADHPRRRRPGTEAIATKTERTKRRGPGSAPVGRPRRRPSHRARLDELLALGLEQHDVLLLLGRELAADVPLRPFGKLCGETAEVVARARLHLDGAIVEA